jgi:transposase
MKKTDFRKLSTEVQDEMRVKAVDAVLNGATIRSVAKIFGVSRQYVGKWVDLFENGGLAALRGAKRGRPTGDGKKLKPWQAAQIAKAVIKRTPDVLELPFALWTREAVQQLIYRRFNIEMAITTVGNYLRNWGFTPQKPVRRAYEQNPAAIKQWVEVDYPAIKALAKKENAEIFWGDETGLRSDYNIGTSFSKKGQTPVIPGTGKRFGCNVISAVNNYGSMRFMIFETNFVTKTFVTFLRQLIARAEHKIFLIVDGHPVHKSKKVRGWLDNHKEDISLFFLPGYAPELNPDELLNHDLKRNSLGKRRAANKKELVHNTRSHLMRRQGEPDVIKNLFKTDHLNYAA